MTVTLYYSAIKRADESIASGLPRIASLMLRALRQTGRPVIAPTLPTAYDPYGDPQTQAHLRDQAEKAADALITELRANAIRPDAVVTYHSYYKSPDWIGPKLKAVFGCRYLVLEPSYAAKREHGPWALNYHGNLRALQSADYLCAATLRDRQGLQPIAPLEKIIDFPPFIDVAPFAQVARKREAGGPVAICTAGMMRDERKAESYARLAAALAGIEASHYTLTIAGDGPLRPQVERCFADLKESGAAITFLGTVPPHRMPDLFAASDLFAWPGVGEAYGLVYLEAQAAGLPVIAEAHKGVPSVVEHTVSGLLYDPDDPAEFAKGLQRLIENNAERHALGRSAQAWVTAHRDIGAAARRLESLLSAGPRP
ncbi:MAG TPA: hypothetical protein DCL54_09725 [Alphaproteobacteria bacterium]|nr:hypothetical protein [Alphaproteobacteria bacterium]